MSSWIASALEHDVADALLGERPLYSAYLDRRVVVELVDAQRTSPTPRRAQLLLAILLFEAWLQTYLPRARAGAHRTSTAQAAVALHELQLCRGDAGARRGGEPHASGVVHDATDRRPTAWVIVENGSADGTSELAERLAAEYEWVSVARTTPQTKPVPALRSSVRSRAGSPHSTPCPTSL